MRLSKNCILSITDTPQEEDGTRQPLGPWIRNKRQLAADGRSAPSAGTSEGFLRVLKNMENEAGGSKISWKIISPSPYFSLPRKWIWIS